MKKSHKFYSIFLINECYFKKSTFDSHNFESNSILFGDLFLSGSNYASVEIFSWRIFSDNYYNFCELLLLKR